jgi:acyl carrier protein
MSEQTIREVLRTHAKLAVDVDLLSGGDDLYAAGLTSHASVNVMLALEEEFDLEFPDELLKKATFSTIGTIEMALAGIRAR